MLGARSNWIEEPRVKSNLSVASCELRTVNCKLRSRKLRAEN